MIKKDKKEIILITNKAINRIKYLLTKRNKPSLGMRVGVKSGGCSGFQYYVEYADNHKESDTVVNNQGITLLIDSKALIYLIGSKMDFVDDQFKSRFTFSNPNEKGQCGCGKSFNI